MGCTEGNVGRSSSWVRRRVDPIGIDFGARRIRMLQLACGRGQPVVTACAQRMLPAGVQDRAEYHRLRSEAVADMLAEGGFVGRDVVTALPWDDLQVRNLRIPTMPEAEIKEVIQFEAAERFGLDPYDAEVRFVVAGDVRQGADVRQEVMVFAARRSTVQDHVAGLAKMGLRPVAIDVGPAAIFRGFDRFLRRTEDHGEMNAFVDLGYSATRVVMSHGPDLMFFKTIPVGGRRFDELVSEQLDLSLSEAAQMRIRLHRQHVAAITGQPAPADEDELAGENVRRAVLDALRPALEQLSKEIALCLRYCSVTFRGPRFDEVTVVGGEACNADILRVLADQVNAPFNVGRPMRSLTFDSDFHGADRRTGQPEWATAVGLALKPVDLGAEVAS